MSMYTVDSSEVEFGLCLVTSYVLCLITSLYNPTGVWAEELPGARVSNF